MENLIYTQHVPINQSVGNFSRDFDEKIKLLLKIIKSKYNESNIKIAKKISSDHKDGFAINIYLESNQPINSEIEDFIKTNIHI